MAVVQCEKGHYYDNAENKMCPHCERIRAGGTEASLEKAQDVARVAKEYILKYGDHGYKDRPKNWEDGEQTVSIYQVKNGVEPVTGWLVCVKGIDRGRGFVLKSGWNMIGTASDMDIILHGDNESIMGKHAAVGYEPKMREFYLRTWGRACLNGKVVSKAEKLKAYDSLVLGDVSLMFIPFCGKSFGWDISAKENKDDGQ